MTNESFMDGPREGQMNDALAALSTIEADAANRVMKCQELLAKYIVPDSGISDNAVINDLIGVLDHPLSDKALSTIAAHNDAVRRECADRAVKYFEGMFVYGHVDEDDLRAAIIGAESGKEKNDEKL